jgi:hypothetical protein
MKRSSFTRADLYMAGKEEEPSRILIGLCDRIAAQGQFGKPMEALEGPDATPDERIDSQTFVAYSAAKRMKVFAGTFEAFKKAFIGIEYDDGEDSPGSTPV